MRKLVILLIFGMMLSNCKSKPINQKIDKKKEEFGLIITNKIIRFINHSNITKKINRLKNGNPTSTEKSIKQKNTKTEFAP